MASAAIREPSLSSRAMLCGLSISMWSAQKHDREASEEIATRHGAQADAGRYHKVLLPKQALAEIRKIVNEARSEHYFMTLPWDDNGYRVLPAAAYMDHTEKMRELANRFTPAVEVLAQQFEQLVAEAKVRLGGLFRAGDYPTSQELRSKFAFETRVMPLPDAGDFRVALGDEEKDRIKRQIAAAVEASLQVASRELWQRLYEAVKHMADRLCAYNVTDEGVEHPFRDSLVTNLVKLVDILPKLNVARDPELEGIAEQVRASLLVAPKQLRESESVRTETAKTAASIADRMAIYSWIHHSHLRGNGGSMITTPQQTTTERKLSRARTQLLLNQPFFGTLCLRLKLEAGSLPTMATDGRRIVYNAEFVEELKPPELEGVLAHEVLHCALAHQCRRGQRDPELWSRAADLAINPILIANGLKLPADALIDPAFNNLSAEEIYARLDRESDGGSSRGSSQSQSQSGPGAAEGGSHLPNNESPCDQKGSPCSNSSFPAAQTGQVPDSATNAPNSNTTPRPGGFGEVMDATDENGGPASEAERNRQHHEWNIAAEQAMRSAKACGREPGNLDRSLTESRESTQDWRSILRNFVAATTLSDYRWSPPNRRHVASGLYLPSVVRSGVGSIVVAVDTSESIGSRELDQFAAEISAISDEAQPEAIHVVYCDAAVQSAEEFGTGEPIHIAPKGGGGTDFRPVFEWVERNGLEPVCLIYLTDLCCHSYPKRPCYPVLWVTDSRRTAPFGETIRLSAD